jgi:septum site-determining protein MinC
MQGSRETPAIQFKGIREGLLLSVAENDLAAALPHLDTELTAKGTFLQGSRVVLQGGNRRLSQSQLRELQDLLAAHDLELWTVLSDHEATQDAARALGLGTRLAGSDTDLDGKPREPAPARPPLLIRSPQRMPCSIKRPFAQANPSTTMGHVIVLGDVNPGAQIIAAGNVVVWGRLRGLVHAGAHGNRDALICALELVPTQLRIADHIAIPPADRPRHPQPEMAAVRDEQIIAEPWRTREHVRE